MIKEPAPPGSPFRHGLRESINAVFTVLTIPLWGVVLALGAAGNRHGVFAAAGQWLGLVPGAPGIWLRRAYYRRTLESCGADFSIGFLSWIAHRSSRIGVRVYVGSCCEIGTVDFGNDVLIGSGVHVLSGRHQHLAPDAERPLHQQSGVFSRTSIGDNVWVGNRAVIMASVASDSVVGAGAVVVKPVNQREVVAGNPARVIKMRPADGK